MSKTEPTTLQEAIVHFADLDVALKTMVELRWPTGVHCPSCGRTDVTFLPARRVWTCKTRHPKWQFSAKVGTIFEDSPLGLDKWFAAIWMVANCKNGISSYEVARDLGITQKSAWFMLHRIRLAMKAGILKVEGKLAGEVEADETYVGGKIQNMSLSKRAQLKKGAAGRGGASGKRAVVGILQRKSGKRSSKVKATHVGNVSGITLRGLIRDNVEPGSRVLTDNFSAYRGLQGEYLHEVVDHVVTYVRGTVHTNGIENYWSLLKRTIRGTYVSVEPFHLGRYLDEQSFRFNERDDVDGGRFRRVLKSVVGRRLTYKELTGNGEAKAPN